MKTIFLDRDGVLNHELIDEWVSSPEKLSIFPWAGACVRRLNDAGYRIIVVTNQQGVGLGLYSLEDLEAIHDKLKNELALHGADVDAVFSATLHPDLPDPDRKPAIGMVMKGADLLGIDPTGSFIIGDQKTDIECGYAAGLRPLLLLSGLTSELEVAGWKEPPEEVFPTLEEAIDYVLGFE